jgi:hypothetical protein
MSSELDWQLPRAAPHPQNRRRLHPCQMLGYRGHALSILPRHPHSGLVVFGCGCAVCRQVAPVCAEGSPARNGSRLAQPRPPNSCSSMLHSHCSIPSLTAPPLPPPGVRRGACAHAPRRTRTALITSTSSGYLQPAGFGAGMAAHTVSSMLSVSDRYFPLMTIQGVPARQTPDSQTARHQPAPRHR